MDDYADTVRDSLEGNRLFDLLDALLKEGPIKFL